MIEDAWLSVVKVMAPVNEMEVLRVTFVTGAGGG